MTPVAASFKRVVQIAKQTDGFDVDRVLVGEFVLLVARNEGETVDAFVELGQREFDRRDTATGKEWQVFLFVGLKVMKCDACEIGNDDVTRNFVEPAFVDKPLDVVESLRLRSSKVFTEALVFDEENAGPKEINRAVVAGDFLNTFLEMRNEAALKPERLEEFVPERLFFSGFTLFARPAIGKLNRAMADFVPRKWHGRIIAKSGRGSSAAFSPLTSHPPE